MIETEVTVPAIGMTARWKLEPLGGQRYRVHHVPSVLELDSGVGYLDVVDLRPGSNGGLELHAVIDVAGWRRFDYVLARDIAESGALADALREGIESHNGVWVRDFVGVLTILLPRESSWDPSEAVVEAESFARRAVARDGPDTTGRSNLEPYALRFAIEPRRHGILKWLKKHW